MSNAIQMSPRHFWSFSASDLDTWKAQLEQDPSCAQELADVFGNWLATEPTDGACDQDHVFCAALALRRKTDLWQRVPFEEFLDKFKDKISTKTVESLRAALDK